MNTWPSRSIETDGDQRARRTEAGSCLMRWSASVAFAVVVTLGSSLAVTAQASAADPIGTPLASVDDYPMLEDGTLVVPAATGVLANDTDPEGDVITAVLTSGPLDNAVPQHDPGVLTLSDDGSFTYSPAPDFDGSVTFTYGANDGTNSSAPVTVTITVTPVNDPPAGVADAYDMTMDTVMVVVGGLPYGEGLLANDQDVEGDTLSAEAMSGPTNGALTLGSNGCCWRTMKSTLAVAGTPPGATSSSATITGAQPRRVRCV